MIETVTSFYESLSLWQAIFLGFLFCVVLWSTLFAVEKKHYRKKSLYDTALALHQQYALEALHVPYAIQNFDNELVPTQDFLTLFGCDTLESLKSAILKKITPQYAAWEHFIRTLAFHVDVLQGTLEGTDGQIYSLNAQGKEGALFLWLTCIKSPYDESLISRKILDNIPVAAWYRDRRFNITQCNLVYARAMDLTKTEVTQDNIELYPARRSGSPYQLALKAIETNKTHIQRLHAVIAGSRRYLEIGVIPFVGGDSMGYAVDMTEVETLQKDLQKHIESHREIMEHLATPIAVFSQDTRVVFFNKAYLKMFQYDEKWLLTKPLLGDMLDDLRMRRKIPEYDNFSMHKRRRINLFKTLVDPTQEILHQPDGQILSLLIIPYPQGGLVYIFEDVTNNIVLERRLNTMNAVQKEALNNLYEGIIVIGLDLRIRLLNKAFAVFMNLTQKESMLGKSLQDMMGAEVPFAHRTPGETYAKLLSLFEKRTLKEGVIQLKNQAWIKYSYIPLPDGSHMMSVLNLTNALKGQEFIVSPSEEHDLQLSLFREGKVVDIKEGIYASPPKKQGLSSIRPT